MTITFDGRGIGYETLMRAGQSAADELAVVVRILDADGVKIATFHPAVDMYEDTLKSIKR